MMQNALVDESNGHLDLKLCSSSVARSLGRSIARSIARENALETPDSALDGAIARSIGRFFRMFDFGLTDVLENYLRSSTFE